MSSKLVNAFRTNSLMRSAFLQGRITAVNKYQWDYSCEDGYFEREMDLYQAKKLTFPIHIERKKVPDHERWPAHINDVRFNYKP